jgi:hypothetical protein
MKANVISNFILKKRVNFVKKTFFHSFVGSTLCYRPKSIWKIFDAPKAYFLNSRIWINQTIELISGWFI